MKNENYKKIQNFSDACIAVGITENMFYQKHIGLSIYLINTAKLEIINKAINGDWSPNWNDNNEYKYYPYFKMSVSSGFGFSDADYRYGYSVSFVGSRLCYESKEQAIYAGNTFIDIYKSVYVIDKNEPSLKEIYNSQNSDLEIEDALLMVEPIKNFDYKIIRTYSDACEKLGISDKEPTFNGILPEFKKASIAQYKLMIIFKAINNGWSPNWSDSKEYKYYPYFNMSVSSGFGFSAADCCYNCSDSLVGSRLCTYSDNVAEYISNQFIELYEDLFCLIDKNKINTTIISLEDMKKIHNIACSDWKNKIINLTNEYKDKNPFVNKVYLPKDVVDNMLKACTKEQLPIVKKIFGK